MRPAQKLSTTYLTSIETEGYKWQRNHLLNGQVRHGTQLLVVQKLVRVARIAMQNG